MAADELDYVLNDSGAKVLIVGKDMRGNAIAGVDTSFILKQSDFGITHTTLQVDHAHERPGLLQIEPRAEPRGGLNGGEQGG